MNKCVSLPGVLWVSVNISVCSERIILSLPFSECVRVYVPVSDCEQACVCDYEHARECDYDCEGE